MAALIKPLGNTLRVVEWEELPASVREVPEDFDPMAEGVLMRHQVQWLQTKASIKIASKGRRTGITFCEALDDTIKAATRKTAGGDNIFYIGDTKEKGLEFIGYCAKFARVIAKAQHSGVSSIEEFLFEDQNEQGHSKQITSYRIRFASGFQITALSSRPANIRGLQGKVVIDEAAFHQDVQGVLDAATALLIWGGEIAIISSHNGKSNPFNLMIRDVEAGRYGEKAAVYTVTFDDAVTNGLYERVCMMKRWTATAASKAEWYANIRNAYGVRKSAMREELDAIPRDGSGVCLPSIWIENAMREERPVLRLRLGDDFLQLSNEARASYAQDWIEKYLDPLLGKLSPKERHGLGQDFARHRDFSVIVLLAVQSNLFRYCPFIVEMHNVPTRQQEQILWRILDLVPRWTIGMDATGSGETIAEYTADRYGMDHVAQIKLNRAWYGTWMPKMIQAFEDGVIDLPKDDNTMQDLRDIEEVDGIPQVLPVRKKDLKDPDLKRHGDTAIAIALAWFATTGDMVPIEYQSMGTRDSAVSHDFTGSGTVVTDVGFGTVSSGLNFRGF